MRVLQVIDSLLLGGAEVLIRHMVPRFERKGINCDIYIFNSADSPLKSSLLDRGTKIFGPIGKSVYSPFHVAPLAAHLRSMSYDLIHVHLFPAQLWVALAAKLAGSKVPQMTTEHSTYSRRRWSAFRAVDRWMYAQYEHVACISDATAQALLAWRPELRSKLRLCPNGVDLDRFANVPPQKKLELFSVPEDSFVALSVGRMEFQKDHETTIRAISLVPNVHLVIVGGGPMFEQLCRLAEQLGVSSRVHFLGRRTDVPNLLRAADVFVQSSRFEGFGIAALEAMASGVPVIATHVGGLADVVNDAGMMFDVRDHQQLARCVSALRDDLNLRTEYSAKAKARAEHFSLEKTVDCYEQLYEEMTSTTAGGRTPLAVI